MAVEAKECFAQKPFKLDKLSIASPNMLVRTSSQNDDPKFECRDGWRLFFTKEFECRNATETHIYNVFTSTWSTLNELDNSLPNRHVFKTRYGKRIAYEYEDGEDLLPDIPRPEHPLECYGSTVYGDYLYTFGDLSISEEFVGDRRFFCEIFRIHLKGMGHEYISRPLLHNSDRRFDYSIVVVAERVFFIGGQGFDQLVDLVEIPVFNLETLSWSTVNTKPDRCSKSVQNYPEARVSPSCLVIDTPNGQEIVIAGGNGKFDNCTDIWALNLLTYEWRFINVIEEINLMIMRVAQSHPHCMYIYGTTGHFEIYRMWLQIPRLETMCLEAISHYRLYKLPETDLIRFRVPPRFFEELKK